MALSSYTVLFDIGLLGGAALSCLMARRYALPLTQVLDSALAAALGGLVAARAVYVASRWTYYGDHVGQALRVWDGGLAWHGGLVGATAGVLLLCAVRRLPPGAILDALTPASAFLATCVWIGCLLAGCSYGAETYSGQGLLWTLSLELPGPHAIRDPRIAVQLLAAGWSALTLIAAIAASKHRQSRGLLLPGWLSLYCAGSFAMGFLRADKTLQVVGWRVDQAVDVIVSLAGTIMCAAVLRKRSRHQA